MMLTQQDCVILLTMIKESTFKGEHLELIYDVALKLRALAKEEAEKEQAAAKQEKPAKVALKKKEGASELAQG